jgi:hypothetical protein
MSLFERFERDLVYLQQNLRPIKSGGELITELVYEGRDAKYDEDGNEKRAA